MPYNYWDNQSFSQPTTDELKRKSAESREKAAKSGNAMEPVIIEGTKITKKWWGNAWCQNLENYADYESRISRGKRYVKTGTVLDLKINKGKVSAKVQGSRKTPYKVEIRISPLSEEKCSRIIERCGRKIQNLEDLIMGNIPQEMQDVITGEDGLFPTPREISMSCSCPDWAIMCKHVAATLYGIGARFDERPLLFFELRGIDPNRFIGITLNNKVDEMLANEGNQSSRIIDDEYAWKLFGLD